MKRIVRIMVSGLVLLFATALCVQADDNPFGNLISGTKIYFSHIACYDGWETEIAVLNPTAETVTGTMTSYNKTGVPIGTPVNITLAPHGRYEAVVSQTFASAGSIDYMVFTASVFGLQGYSKFYQGGIRASIMASGPRTTGLFTKIDQEGWTGIAFINTASASNANVVLTAYNNAGQVVATQNMSLVSGEKKLGVADNLFSSSLAGATYISFSADQGVVGFFLNGNSLGTMLDGSQAL